MKRKIVRALCRAGDMFFKLAKKIDAHCVKMWKCEASLKECTRALKKAKKAFEKFNVQVEIDLKQKESEEKKNEQ